MPQRGRACCGGRACKQQGTGRASPGPYRPDCSQAAAANSLSPPPFLRTFTDSELKSPYPLPRQPTTANQVQQRPGLLFKERLGPGHDGEKVWFAEIYCRFAGFLSNLEPLHFNVAIKPIKVPTVQATGYAQPSIPGVRAAIVQNNGIRSFERNSHNLEGGQFLSCKLLMYEVPNAWFHCINPLILAERALVGQSCQPGTDVIGCLFAIWRQTLENHHTAKSAKEHQH